MKCRVLVVLGALLGLVAGCSRSSSGPPALSAATIDGSGGQITVTNGPQAGLTLTVPAGAVDRPTTFLIVDDSLSLPPEVRAPSFAPLPGLPFRIEPRDLVLDVAVTLRAPYRPENVGETAPGNVQLAQESPFATRAYDPEAVDVVDGWLETRIKTFGRFQVVRGPRVEAVTDYLPAIDEVIELTDGRSFVIRSVDPASPFAGAAATAWQISGPGQSERLVFDGTSVVGRESDQPSWREIWSAGIDVFAPIGNGLNNVVVPMTVEQPLGSPSTLPAQLAGYGFRQYGEPRAFGGRLRRDVLRLTLDLAWDRPEIGVGQRGYVFWFAPGVGLLAYAQDGVVFERLRE